MALWAPAACVSVLLALCLLARLCLGRSSSWVRPGCHRDDPDSPRLVCKPSALAKYLLKTCRTFTSGCEPHWVWKKWSHLQTFRNGIWPSGISLEFLRDYLQLADEGLVALDWAVARNSTRRRVSSNSPAPIVLIIPNSFGKITRNVLKLCASALDCGHRPVIFNRRCQNGSLLTTLKLQQFGDPSDLREAVRYIRYKHPNAKLFTVSESTGAGLLLAYLGECGSSSYVTSAACISPVFRCQEWFETGPPWIYRWLLLLYQKTWLSRYTTVLGEIVDMDKVFATWTLREAEELLFCKTRKNSLCWDVYWEKNDPLRDVDEVAVPVLCICSQDDPFRGNMDTSLPFELFESNPHFFLLLTKYGGHCGFLKRGSAVWSHEVLLEYFRSVSEFFVTEERTKSFSKRKSTASGGSVAFKCGRGNNYKRDSFCTHNIHDIFNWQRSYTR
ncbi:protein ABHD15 [Callorhinchus milii]|uniref:Protein ABHD15 n=1 Tax=Callorhinchus milii TaxID=7868 RepID=V9KUL1_CALMI|nr:protein ABHD15 [Callorhinchus milii]|eukprot:gi/632958052/ref/XP_007894817.1/ PREDICTED: abhydrolase domain-containing protein 15-like [Callorhinchus milii]